MIIFQGRKDISCDLVFIYLWKKISVIDVPDPRGT
jgi:hypothetical protein